MSIFNLNMSFVVDYSSSFVFHHWVMTVLCYFILFDTRTITIIAKIVSTLYVLLIC